MATEFQSNLDSIKTEYVQVVRDFSQYLSFQRQIGNTGLDISEKSKELINNWGTKSRTRRSFLFEGPENAAIFILDSEKIFFKGESGELLKKILKAMNLSLNSVFICNADDIKSVEAKISVVSPKVIITLGTKAGQSLLKLQHPLEQFRGKFHEYKGIKVMPTFHPSFLLKKPEYKRQVWEDMKLVMNFPGLKDGS